MNTSTPPLHGPKELQTRFLYPFFFGRQSVRQAAEALQAQTLTLSNGKSHDLWACATPHHFYQDELLHHVIRFLFGDAPTTGAAAADEERACRYLKLSDVAANALFKDAELPAFRDAALPLRIIPGVGVEVFLSSQGVGVLSLALTPGKTNLSFAEACDFNYRLAQFRRRDATLIRLRHPQDTAATWERVPEANRAKIAPPPAADAPLQQRLGAPGGAFSLRELIGELLRPLETGESDARALGVQDELAVYTVARLGAEADFADANVREQLSPFLSALAQVEESGHAGAPPGELAIANATLNRKHWAAVSLLGAAHFVADQTEKDAANAIAFDEQRVPVVRDKYFVPYLVALQQQLSLHRASEDATALALAPQFDPVALNELRPSITSVRRRWAFRAHQQPDGTASLLPIGAGWFGRSRSAASSPRCARQP